MSKVRNCVEIYYDIQDTRIRTFNRLRTVGEVHGVQKKHLKDLEKELSSFIGDVIKDHPMATYLLEIKGIGVVLTGGILAYFDPYKADHISGFWKYAGLHVEGGKAPKRKRGKKIEYNPKVKTLCWKIADSFIKHRTPKYRDIYDSEKIKQNKKLGNPLENPKNCPMYEECRKRVKTKKLPCKMHIHLRAMRKMVKIFLGDLWLEWRQVEDLPITPPYPHRDDSNWKP
jgi:hypothetical protein